MYSDRVPSGGFLKGALLCILLLAAIAAAVIFLKPQQNIRENGASAIRTAIERCALQCYTVEGIYPPDLDYLENNYGLQINRKAYFVSYEAYASNQPPTVRVAGKQS